MTKIEFAVLVEEVLNEFGCTTQLLTYNDEGICKVFYEGIDEWVEDYFLVAYKFMNRARLRLIIMDELDLLIPVDPELDLGF